MIEESEKKSCARSNREDLVKTFEGLLPLLFIRGLEVVVGHKEGLGRKMHVNLPLLL